MTLSIGAIFKTFTDTKDESPIWTAQPEQLTERFMLQKLRSFGIKLDRHLLRQLGEDVYALDQITDPMIDSLPEKIKNSAEVDWVYVCVAELWRRWFPDVLVFEFVANRVYSVYDLLATGNVSAAGRIWYKTWPHIVRFLDMLNVEDANDFRNRFGRYDELLFWIGDIGRELAHEGGVNHFAQERIAFCEQVLRRLYPDDSQDETAHTVRELLARSYVTAGNLAKAEELFERWLDADPLWASGWVCWSCCYSGIWGDTEDIPRAENLLRTGLAMLERNEIRFCPETQDKRVEILQHLVALLEEQGRFFEAQIIERELVELSKPMRAAARVIRQNNPSKTDLLKAVSWLNKAVRSPKIALKGPCPCGSGSKFKRCCG